MTLTFTIPPKPSSRTRTTFRALGGTAARLAAVLGTCFAMNGCTLIGAGIGALVPHSERVSESSRLRAGDRIMVRVSGRTKSESSFTVSGDYAGANGKALHLVRVSDRYSELPSFTVSGDYAGTDGNALYTRSDSGAASIPFERVERLRVERLDRRNGSGSYWGVGATVGLVIDVAFMVVMATSYDGVGDLTPFGGGGGFGGGGCGGLCGP